MRWLHHVLTSRKTQTAGWAQKSKVTAKWRPPCVILVCLPGEIYDFWYLEELFNV